MKAQRREEGTTLVELVMALGIGAVLVSVLASAVSILLWLPGERRDRVNVVQDLQFAEHWITRDANSAASFTAGSSPTYGTFSWSDYTGVNKVDWQAIYSYDSANGYLMRTEKQNSVTYSTLAAAKNIASQSDAVFVWNPSTFSVQATLTSTISTATLAEGITTTVRSAAITMAARPRSEPVTSPPGDVAIPPPPAGSEYYYVDGEPVLISGSYVSGGATQLLTADTVYYVVDSTAGANKQAVYTVRSQSLTAPSTISQIEVRFVGTSNRTAVNVNFFVKDSAAGFPTLAESGFTFTSAGEYKTSSFIVSPAALSYINSLPDRRLDLKVESTGSAGFTLSSDQIMIVASP